MAPSASSAHGVEQLFEPFESNVFKLKHRIVHAPLTRCRAVGNCPGEETVEYYVQRATAGGLIIAEATVVSPDGHGYVQTPGLYTEEQEKAWRRVTDAVRAKGGLIVAQLWHVGRVSAAAFQPNGGAPVAASALPIPVDVGTRHPRTFKPIPLTPPRQLSKEELPKYQDYYVEAARSAIRAGFHAVEVHCGHGYLLDGFLKDSSNDRTDEYGGSVENRARFPLEVVRAVAAAIGPQRTTVRLTPFSSFLGARSSLPYSQFIYVLEQLNSLDLAYVHLVEPRVNGVVSRAESEVGDWTLRPFREVYKGKILVAGGYTPELAARAIASGEADLVAFGRHFISNPDLVERVRLGAPLIPYEREVFYAPRPGQGISSGYTDYRPLSREEAEVLSAELATAAA